MTQSAVSKQVAQLEALLGVALFYRTSQGIFLSPAGQRYYLDALDVLQQLERATIHLMTQDAQMEVLRIVSHPTFCAQWLIPALKGFGAAYPNIQLEVKEEAAPLLDTQAADVAFLSGDGVWVDMTSERLFDEYCVAVCAPDYLSKDTDVQALMDESLLQLNSRPSAWYDYFHQQGQRVTSTLKGAKFDTFYACINAAQMGCGVALVPMRFVSQALADGDLVTALPYQMKSTSAYYMVYQSRLTHTPKIQAIRTWIADYLTHSALR